MKSILVWGISVFSLIEIAGAQTASINGEITGTVVDPSGAAVAGATVIATNAGTGYQQSTVTTPEGLYRIPVLPIGQYSVSVTAKGFAKYERSGINLDAGAIATVDVKLDLQNVTTAVLVSSSAPVVDPGSTDQGNTVSSNAVQNLPLVSRNPFNFILEQPEISATATPNSAFRASSMRTDLPTVSTMNSMGTITSRAIVPAFACFRSPRFGSKKFRR
jgi:Carboxypeptidase regulatory-like domain